jgi:hypothetical protein
VDINFDKYAAETKDTKEQEAAEDALGHSILMGGLMGGATALWKNRGFEKNRVEELTNDAVESSRFMLPTFAPGSNEALDRVIAGPQDLFEHEVVNRFSGELDAPQSAFQEEMKKVVAEHPHLSVSEFHLNPDKMREIIMADRAAAPLKEKIMERLRYVGKPAAIVAALGLLEPVIQHLVTNGFASGSDEEKEALKNHLAKQAAETMVDCVIEDMEKRAIEDITQDQNISNLIDKYGK